MYFIGSMLYSFEGYTLVSIKVKDKCTEINETCVLVMPILNTCAIHMNTHGGKIIELVVCEPYLWYAGVAVPQILQYVRESDAPAMQSCKPLPCGTGS